MVVPITATVAFTETVSQATGDSRADRRGEEHDMWILDSGVSHRTTNNSSILTNYRPYPGFPSHWPQG